MGLLEDGIWRDTARKPGSKGEFVRVAAQLRNWITPDGKGDGEFPAELGRYHLYVSYACPWAHRTLIFRQLKGLADHIGFSVVSPLMLNNGWEFTEWDGATGDRANGLNYMHQIYTKNIADYSGRCSVPVLWDTKTDSIVSNESSEIIRMLNSAFDGLTGNNEDFYPEDLRNEIDLVNERVYETVNNGVYRSGFAQSQDSYEEAVTALFDTIDWLEERLSQQRYLCGDRITEADWRLFPTMIRFDHVYHGHFKCNIRRLIDYPNLFGHTRELYQWPGVKETVNMDHIRWHYYYSHPWVNPTRVVSVGPDIDFDAPHGRG
ncbi:MAG: glutathione S-transferase family protein [Minwuia sp.]|uniref:glutathione S-transferase family protein n=1 Tax=Minwuia sp. TaxID=2493630 RepID=UPI003A87C17C